MFRINFPKLTLLVACLSLLAACSNFMRSNVLTFHESPMPHGETIRVQAMDDGKAKSLEFRNYAKLLEQELREIGYTPVDSDESAELIARVDYDISKGSTETWVEPDSAYARYHFYAGNYYNPLYFGIGRDWDTRRYTVTNFERSLTMNIEKAGVDGERIFEGRVRSSGAQNDLPSVMPYLITAMFTNFPGENGVTKVVTIETAE